jgi:hypothetical protein
MEAATTLGRREDERQAVDAATRGGLEAIVAARSPDAMPKKLPAGPIAPEPAAPGQQQPSAQLQGVMADVRRIGGIPQSQQQPPDSQVATPPPVPGPTTERVLDPVVARQAQAPGGGQQAMATFLKGEAIGTARDRLAANTAIAGNRNQMQVERFALTALSKGNAAEAQYWAQRGGINIPPQVLQNANVGRLFGTGALMAQRLYGTDKAGAMRFTRAFIENGGDPVAASQAAGQPNPTTGSGRGTPGQIVQTQNPDGSIGYAIVDRSNPNAPARPVTAADGTPLGAPPRGAGNAATRGQGSQSSARAKYELLRQAGVPEAEAANIATGNAAKPATIASMYKALRTEIVNDPKIKPEQREPAIEEAMKGLFGPVWRTRMGGSGVGGPAPAATPATPAPAVAPAPAPSPPAAPAARPPAPGTIVVQDGKRYRINPDGTGTEVQ